MEANDMKAMREALKMFVDAYRTTSYTLCIENLRPAFQKAEAALAAPPRQCDKFGTDNVEAYLAYEDLCAKGETEESIADAIAWLLSIDQERANHGSK